MSDKLIKADLGPYASRIYKFQLFSEYYMSDNNALKFLHFNNTDLIKSRRPRSKHTKQKEQSRTVAALAVSPHAIRKAMADFLLAEADQEVTMPMAVGVTLVSFDDMYNRAKGRDEAVKQMAELDVKIESINANETHLYINLAPVKGVALTLRLNRKTGFSSVLGQIVGPGK